MDVNYVLYGEEAALIRKKISNIAKKASLATDRISTYDALQTPLKVVLEDVSTMPFFEENKMVVVMNCTFLSSKDTTGYALDALLTYLRDPLPSTILILCCECAKLDQRKRVVKEIVSCCESMVCSRISDHDKETVIKDLIREYNIKIDQEALQLLVQRLPLDVGIIEKEIEKLGLYGNKIHVDEVRHLTIRALEDNVFDLADALLMHRMQKAFALWKDLDAQQIDPIFLIATLASQFRFLFQVKTLMNKGMTKNNIKDVLGAHPYRVQVSMNQCRNLSASLLLENLKKLADLDQSIKSGRVDKKQGFEIYLLKTSCPRKNI